MGCGSSSLKGHSYPSINTNSPASRQTSAAYRTESHASAATSYTSKPQVQSSHYQSPNEHDKDLVNLTAEQRRPSRPAYVDIGEGQNFHHHRKESYHEPDPSRKVMKGMVRRFDGAVRRV